MAIQQASTTTVTITYNHPAAATDVMTITHTAMAADDNTVRDRIQDSVVSALSTAWLKPAFDVSLKGLVSAASGAVTVTGIALG